MNNQDNELSPSLGDQPNLTGDEPSIGGEWAAQAALSGLASDDWRVRVRAAQELARRGDERAIADLVASLNDWNGAVRKEVARALIHIGAEAVPALLECLAQADDVTGRAVISVLSGIGAPAMPALIETLGRGALRTQRDIIRAMGSIQHEDAIPYLVEALGNDGADIRIAATRSLNQFGEKAAPALMDVLDSDNVYTRSGACDLLGRVHYRAAVPKLITLIEDEQQNVRRHAVQALGSIGTQEALDALLGELRSDDEDRREWAIHALGSIHRPASIAALMDTAANDPSLDVRSHAVGHLGRLKAVKAIPLLGERLGKETDFSIRDSIVRALADMDHPDAVPFIYSVLGEAGQLGGIAHEAMYMLSNTGHALTKAFFMDELRSESARLRMIAVEVLARLGDPDLVSSLIPLLSDTAEAVHRSPDGRIERLRVCDVAAYSLEQIGTPQARKAVISWREQHPAG